VNKLSSIKTQLPYDFYSLDYCKPKTIVNSAENLGEVLRGDRIENSPYVVSIIVSILARLFIGLVVKDSGFLFFAVIFEGIKVCMQKKVWLALGSL
jgi:transmembrane 9 superfamily protein 2/4